jgi:uncharacterized protein (DUF885 family)
MGARATLAATMNLPAIPRAARGLGLAGAVALGLCAAAGAQSLRAPATEPSRNVAVFHATLEAARLHALLDADAQFRLEQHPELASRLGDHRFDDRLDDRSPEGFAREDAHVRDQLKALRRLDRDALSGEDLLSLDCALHDAQIAVELQRYPGLRTRALSNLDGPQTALPALMRDLPVRGEADAVRALARLKAMPRRIAQDVARLREGRRTGWLPPRSAMARVPGQIDGLLAAAPASQPLLDPFRRLPSGLPPERRQALQDEAAAVLRDQVVPAFLELRKVVADELLPAAPESGALGAYPDGAALYALLVRRETTLPLAPKALHETGLAEVARLRAQIVELMRASGFVGGEADFAAALNQDPRFFHADPEALLADYRDLAKRVDPMLPRLFLALPRAPYGVRAIPAWDDAGAAGRYREGALDGAAPGWFEVDAAALGRHPRWRMEDLFLREAVPGRHLQVARQRELLQLPLSRRIEGSDGEMAAYADGWALYAEGLGTALGLEADPPARYGQLMSELRRAAWLVADTGLHALGWTPAQAAAYLVDEAAESPGDAAAEVERDEIEPARALAAKVGQMKLLELRRHAEAALGERFDVRAFHQEVLDHGPLPLPALERVIDDWIARAQAADAGSDAHP